MKPFLSAILLLSLMIPADAAQRRHDWASVTARLHTGDHIAISLTTSSASGIFQSATADGLITDAGTYRRADVLKIERIHSGGSTRLKHALWGAAMGGGAGAGIGAATGGCSSKPFALCLGRGVPAGIDGGIGVLAGALLGALLPAHGKHELVYSVK